MSLISNTNNRIINAHQMLSQKNQLVEQIKMNLQNLFYLNIEKSILETYNYNELNSKFLKERLEEIKPDIIINDTFDFYIKNLVEKKEIECISYLTNNMYSFEYLERNRRQLYSHFFRIKDYKQIYDDNFYNNLKVNLRRVMFRVARKLNYPTIEPFPQNNLKEKVNLIYTLPKLHPEVGTFEKENSKYFFLQPSVELFKQEENSLISNKLFDFITDKKEQQLAYISTGSFAGREKEFYFFWVNMLIQQGFKVILSSNLDEEIFLNHFKKNEVYIGKNLPQKYILSHSDLFVTSGGWNSVLESIFYEVPMILSPFTGEQTLNALILEEAGLGRTLVKKRTKSETAESILYDVLANSSEIKERMSLLREDYWEEEDLQEFCQQLLNNLEA